MSTSSSRIVSNILDIPNEILVKIIMNLNARERVQLGKTCKRFESMVFGAKELLRDLDFSKDGRLTTVSDIDDYLRNEKARKEILRLNLRNVNCMDAEKFLNDYISKAVNLVSLNIQGTKIDDLGDLASLLKSLEHVEKLSVDWPRKIISETCEAGSCYKIFKKSFGRLSYLSVRMWHVPNSDKFTRHLLLCKKLRELRMVGRRPYVIAEGEEPVIDESKRLKNLEIVEFCGTCLGGEKEYFASLFRDSKELTDFQLRSHYSGNGFYLERNVKVCDELLDSGLLVKNYADDDNADDLLLEHGEFGKIIFAKNLLKEVIKVTHEILNAKFCCLTQFRETDMCLVEIEEQKRLLEDPRYELRRLEINHNIEEDCDLHLLVSAFPNLKELVLSNVIRGSGTGSRHREKRLRRKYNNSSELISTESDLRNVNRYSSFEMIVDNTPYLEKFSLNTDDSFLEEDETWDLSALPKIAGWSNLKSLRLSSVPIEDGYFLIEIGKQCVDLETLELFDLGPWASCCYIDHLLDTLSELKNLREFQLRQDNIGKVSKIFNSLANNNSKLRTVSVISEGEVNSADDLIKSVERFLRNSKNLTTFECIIDELSEGDTNDLISLLKNFKRESRIQDFQFQVVWSMDFVVDDSEGFKEGVICKDAPIIKFPCDIINTALY